MIGSIAILAFSSPHWFPLIIFLLIALSLYRFGFWTGASINLVLFVIFGLFHSLVIEKYIDTYITDEAKTRFLCVKNIDENSDLRYNGELYLNSEEYNHKTSSEGGNDLTLSYDGPDDSDRTYYLPASEVKDILSRNGKIFRKDCYISNEEIIVPNVRSMLKKEIHLKQKRLPVGYTACLGYIGEGVGVVVVKNGEIVVQDEEIKWLSSAGIPRWIWSPEAPIAAFGICSLPALLVCIGFSMLLSSIKKN